MSKIDESQDAAAPRGWVACSCAFVALLVAGSAGAAEAPDVTVTVRVYNYAGASNLVLHGAEREVTRIFSAAGIDTRWVDCSGTSVPARPVSAEAAVGAEEPTTDCLTPVTGSGIVLRILSRTTPASKAFRDTMFGFAEGGFVATVFYARLENLADGVYGNRTGIPTILGDVIAHEMGHLLLGTHSHSRTGVMCGKWDKEYLRLAGEGFQTFSLEQSAVMRAAVLRRQTEISRP